MHIKAATSFPDAATALVWLEDGDQGLSQQLAYAPGGPLISLGGRTHYDPILQMEKSKLKMVKYLPKFSRGQKSRQDLVWGACVWCLSCPMVSSHLPGPQLPRESSLLPSGQTPSLPARDWLQPVHS